MNWDAIGAVGELVGATAVVISLLYLAIQIRAQTKQASLTAMHDVAVGFRDAISMLSDTQMAGVYVKSFETFDSLEDHELFQTMVTSQQLLRVWEEAFYLHLDGRLDDRYWAGMNRQYLSFMSGPAMKHTWKLRREYYGDEFKKMVDEGPRTEYRYR